MTRVALMRVPTPEVSLLRNMFNVVASRGLLYEIAETASEVASAELAIVDADNHTALSLWNALRVERPEVVGILISRTPAEGDGQLWMRRPLNSMKVLAALGRADLKRNPAPSKRRGLPGESPRSIRGARVLVIEDSPTVRKQLELTLGEQDVSVQCAETGEAGLHLLSTDNFDMIFLDVVLPGADGYQICKTIKKNKLKAHTPVVMLTSKSSPFDRVKGSLAGCDSYLTKPVELRKLFDCLQKYLPKLSVAEQTSSTADGAASAI